MNSTLSKDIRPQSSRTIRLSQYFPKMQFFYASIPLIARAGTSFSTFGTTVTLHLGVMNWLDFGGQVKGSRLHWLYVNAVLAAHSCESDMWRMLWRNVFEFGTTVQLSVSVMNWVWRFEGLKVVVASFLSNPCELKCQECVEGISSNSPQLSTWTRTLDFSGQRLNSQSPHPHPILGVNVVSQKCLEGIS